MNFAGKHYVAAVHLYDKAIINGRPQYQSVKWLDPDNSEAKEVVAYASKVLDAIDFDYGPAHIEIFLTPEGPRLVEVNPRVSGAYGFFNQMCKQITGKDQIDLLVDLYLNGKVEYECPFQSKNNLKGEVVCLVNNSDFSTIKPDRLEQIRQLPSCQAISMLYESNFPKTIDIHTLAGYLLLVNSDAKQLSDDYETARTLDLFGDE